MRGVLILVLSCLPLMAGCEQRPTTYSETPPPSQTIVKQLGKYRLVVPAAALHEYEIDAPTEDALHLSFTMPGFELPQYEYRYYQDTDAKYDRVRVSIKLSNRQAPTPDVIESILPDESKEIKRDDINLTEYYPTYQGGASTRSFYIPYRKTESTISRISCTKTEFIDYRHCDFDMKVDDGVWAFVLFWGKYLEDWQFIEEKVVEKFETFRREAGS